MTCEGNWKQKDLAHAQKLQSFRVLAYLAEHQTKREMWKKVRKTTTIFFGGGGVASYWCVLLKYISIIYKMIIIR